MSRARLLDLPAELLCLIFDRLGLGDLLRMSHVCGHCRTIAHAHPTFWRDIDNYCASETRLDLFRFRLQSTTTVGLRLTIDITILREAEEVRTIVLPAIGRNLFRTALLRLEVPPDFHCEVFELLRRPALHLETLGLYFFGPDPVLFDLPGDIVVGKCPRLHTLELHDCAFPNAPNPALAGAARFESDTPNGRGLPLDLFALLPAVKHVEIKWRGEFADRKRFYAQFQHAPPLLPLSLQAVEMHTRGHDPRLPGTLGIELELELEYNDVDCVRYAILSHSHGWRRIFAADVYRDPDWPQREFYESKFIGKRITTLAVDASLAYVSRRVGELAACETLRLRLDRGLKVMPYIHRPRTLPSLKRIALRADSPVKATVIWGTSSSDSSASRRHLSRGCLSFGRCCDARPEWSHREEKQQCGPSVVE
ncbi:hypothetical protein AURDEDRAFT_124103 [Auricularia subglabra TFB-10046 SS5]|nr:hypothetical protein AURDEDRAFT_124103 [Auricularia subglabra TFB-10046 SS5]